MGRPGITQNGSANGDQIWCVVTDQGNGYPADHGWGTPARAQVQMYPGV